MSRRDNTKRLTSQKHDSFVGNERKILGWKISYFKQYEIYVKENLLNTISTVLSRCRVAVEGHVPP